MTQEADWACDGVVMVVVRAADSDRPRASGNSITLTLGSCCSARQIIGIRSKAPGARCRHAMNSKSTYSTSSPVELSGVVTLHLDRLTGPASLVVFQSDGLQSSGQNERHLPTGCPRNVRPQTRGPSQCRNPVPESRPSRPATDPIRTLDSRAKGARFLCKRLVPAAIPTARM